MILFNHQEKNEKGNEKCFGSFLLLFLSRLVVISFGIGLTFLFSHILVKLKSPLENGKCATPMTSWQSPHELWLFCVCLVQLCFVSWLGSLFMISSFCKRKERKGILWNSRLTMKKSSSAELILMQIILAMQSIWFVTWLMKKRLY